MILVSRRKVSLAKYDPFMPQLTRLMTVKPMWWISPGIPEGFNSLGGSSGSLPTRHDRQETCNDRTNDDTSHGLLGCQALMSVRLDPADLQRIILTISQEGRPSGVCRDAKAGYKPVDLTRLARNLRPDL